MAVVAPAPDLAPLHQKVHLFRDDSRMLQTGLGKYFNNPLFSDVVVVPPDGRRLHCHQLVLAAGSARFARMLEAGTTLKGDELPVWGVDSAGLEAVLNFFYSGECLLCYDNMVAVMDAAQRLDVKPLLDACNAFISTMMFPYTVTTILRQATDFKLQALVQNCLSYITSRLEEVSNTDDFLAASYQLLMKIITAAKGQHPELTLFRAAWHWVISDPQNVQHLESIMRVIKVPDITFDELLALGGTRGLQLPSDLSAVLEAATGNAQNGGLSMGQLQAAALGNAAVLAQASGAMLPGSDSAPDSGNLGSKGDKGTPGPSGLGGRPMPNRVCQVEGCWADLRNLRDYHLRYKICEYHLKVPSIIRDGKPQRFCQQCGRFQPLGDFDQNKRSCRARLERHNARRRKRGDEEGPAGDLQANEMLADPSAGMLYSSRGTPRRRHHSPPGMTTDDDADEQQQQQHHQQAFGSLQQLSAAMAAAAAAGGGGLEGYADGFMQMQAGLQPHGMMWQPPVGPPQAAAAAAVAAAAGGLPHGMHGLPGMLPQGLAELAEAGAGEVPETKPPALLQQQLEQQQQEAAPLGDEAVQVQVKLGDGGVTAGPTGLGTLLGAAPLPAAAQGAAA